VSVHQTSVATGWLHTLQWLAGRIRPHFMFKALGTSAFMTVFFTAYIYLLKSPSGPVTVMPLTIVDQWVPFEPWALPIYLSLWVYVSLPPALMQTREEVVDFGGRIGLLCLIGLAVFYAWPNAVPPANIDWALYPGASVLKGVDAAGNACPSLHVATAVFSGLWLEWSVPRTPKGQLFRWCNLAWCAAIAYSTLATRQHVAVDVACGALLGTIMAVVTRPHALQPLTTLATTPSRG
jgi:membrane-associated phospholipid phosphatase